MGLIFFIAIIGYGIYAKMPWPYWVTAVAALATQYVLLFVVAPALGSTSNVDSTYNTLWFISWLVLVVAPWWAAAIIKEKRRGDHPAA